MHIVYICIDQHSVGVSPWKLSIENGEKNKANISLLKNSSISQKRFYARMRWYHRHQKRSYSIALLVKSWRIHNSTVKSQIITSYYHILSYWAIPTCKVLEFQSSCHIDSILSSISNYDSQCSYCNKVILPHLERPLSCILEWRERRKRIIFFSNGNTVIL